MKKELPAKLSELLRLAVEDAKKLSKNPKYVLCMLDWHLPLDKKCAICMAGAVMACELKTNRNDTVMPEDLGEEVNNKLMAINALREGNIIEAFNNLNGDINWTGYKGGLSEEQLPACWEAGSIIRDNYNDSAYRTPTSDRAPWHIYLKAAKILEKAGL